MVRIPEHAIYHNDTESNMYPLKSKRTTTTFQEKIPIYAIIKIVKEPKRRTKI